jgi:hypothetical protein
MFIQYKDENILTVQLKINHLSEDRNMFLFLAQWTVCLQTRTVKVAVAHNKEILQRQK